MGTPSPFHNTSTTPMSFLGRYPSDWSQVPSWDGTPVPYKDPPVPGGGYTSVPGGGTPVPGGGVCLLR